MGEYAEEARQLENNIREANISATGKPYPYTRYDDNYWEDAIGILREIRFMDSMHICMVLKQLEIIESKSKRKLAWLISRRHKMYEQLRLRGFKKDDFEFNVVGVKMGIYCFYPDDVKSDALVDYYRDLLAGYNDIKPPKLLN